MRLPPRIALGALAGFLVGVPLALLALAVRSGWGPLRRLDRAVADGLHGFVAAKPGLVRVLDVLAVVLDPWVFRFAVLVLVGVLVVRGAHRLAWWAGITMAAGSLLGFGLKLVFARVRPAFDLPVATAPGFSFPSGHTLNSAVGTMVILLVVVPALPGRMARVAAWVAGAVVVLVTAFDRIALGVHFLSDVLAAWLIAAALVAGTVAAFQIWRREQGLPATEPLVEGVEPEASRRAL
jgi:membrane-associated phospholipid phosphatase